MTCNAEWSVDQQHISELTEQYKKERRGKKNSKCIDQHTMCCVETSGFILLLLCLRLLSLRVLSVSVLTC